MVLFFTYIREKKRNVVRLCVSVCVCFGDDMKSEQLYLSHLFDNSLFDAIDIYDLFCGCCCYINNNSIDTANS